MRKALVPLLVFGLLAALVAIGKARPELAEQRRRKMASRMRERIESMPADFPPRLMHDNLAATRANTERILEILEASTPGKAAAG